jgi:hypothetical protein
LHTHKSIGFIYVSLAPHTDRLKVTWHNLLEQLHFNYNVTWGQVWCLMLALKNFWFLPFFLLAVLGFEFRACKHTTTLPLEPHPQPWTFEFLNQSYSTYTMINLQSKMLTS